MFQVLRPADQRDGTCTLESATPRGGPITATRLACLRCREKKVRCTGDKDGCQRCQDKQVPCSYAPPARPESSLSTNSAHIVTAASQNEQPVSSPRTEEQQLSSNLPEDTIPKTTSQILSEAATQNFTSTSEDAIEAYDFDHDISQSVSMHDAIFETLDMPTSNTVSSFALFESHIQDPLLDLSGSDSTDTSHLVMSPDHGSSESRSAGNDREDQPSCHSSHDMLRTFEAVEVCLMWTQRGSCAASPSLGLEEMLTCQKEVLESCRLRLSCTSCRLKSYDAVILINICEKLLGSMIRIQALVESQRDQERSQLPSSLRLSTLLDSSAGPYSLVEQVLFTSPESKQHYKMPSRNSLSRQHSKSFDMGLSDWNIDEEDTFYALLSLLGIRMGKLKRVVQDLEDIVLSNRWSVHTRMLQELRAHISKRQIGILNM